MTRRAVVQVKRVLASSVALLLCLYPVQAKSLPIDGKVISGSVTIKQPNTNTLNINQASDKAIINWKGFNINVNELVKFNQSKSSSVALNRVIGVDPSVILGKLVANGRVFIVNPNGIFFGPNSSVDVAGLFASTLGIKDTDFLAGKYNFMQDPTKNPSYVVNQGQIKVSDDGFVFLVAPGVKNENLIIANLGKVVLASGQQFTVDFMGDGLINFVVDGKVVDKVIGPEGNPLPSAVNNSGTIKADGGQVILTARASKDIFSSVVNNSGIIEAKSLVNRGGVIRLEGSDPVENTGQVGWQANLAKVQNAEGAVTNSGTLDVSAAQAGAAQGQVTLSGELVGVSGTILARGADGAQGGRVLITSTANSELTNTSLIETSGVGNSSAGNVVVWSDNTTLFGGTILARGGDLGGNGGNAEVSGHEHLLVTGYADLRAPFGAVGTLVLDPGTVFICHLTASCAVSSGGLDTFSDDYINAQLVLGNLTITTATASGTNGFGPDIVFQDSTIAISWATTIFTLTAGWNITVQGSVSGGAGSTLNVNFGQSGDVVPYTLDLSGATTVTAATVNFIGASPRDIIIGQNVANAWNITGANSGTLNGMNFSGIEVLTGGTGADTFTLAAGVPTFNGLINGGGAANTNTLAATNGTNTWAITEPNSGTLNTTTSFVGISSLIGGSGADNFIFTGSGNVSSITGGLGFDTVDFSALETPVTLTLGGSSTELIIGNGGTLIGSNTDNTWTISGTNAGNVNDGVGTVAFTNFISLTGGNLNDSFILAGGSLSGAINGGAGNNTLTGGNVSNAWNITGPNSGTVTGIGAGFTNIQNLTGGSSMDTFTFTGSGSLTGSLRGGADGDTANLSALTTPAILTLGDNSVETVIGNGGTLVGANLNNSWTISGTNAGSLTDGSGTVAFTNIASLTGGTGLDSFILAGGSLSGSINGGAGTNTLIGNNGANTWTITGANSGTVTGINGGFTNIQDLSGGTGADNFVFNNGASLSGNIDGRGGVDTLNWSAVSAGRSVTLTGPGSIDGFQGVEASVSGGFNNINDVRGSATATNDALIVSGTVPVTFTATQITQGTATIDYSQFDSLVAPQTTGTIIAGSFKDPPPIISPGALIFDTTTVDGNLSATANGAVSQIGPLTVSGITTINAATNTITLNNPLNDFQGTVNLQGSNIALTDANTLNIGVFKSSGGGASIISAGPMVAVSPDPSLSLLFNTDPKTNLDLIGDSQLRAGGDIGSQNAPLVVSLGSTISVAARIANLVSGPPRNLAADEIDSVDTLALFLNGTLIGGSSVAATASTLSALCEATATGGCQKLISVVAESLVLEEPSRIRLEEELKRRLQISEGFEDMPLAVAAVTLNFRPPVGLVSLFDGSSQSDS